MPDLQRIDAYWRAANYLTIGQIYLLDNPLRREPLRTQHVRLRLLGHWGTSPGLNLIHKHMNRIIRAQDAIVIYVCGPVHGWSGDAVEHLAGRHIYGMGLPPGFRFWRKLTRAPETLAA